MTTVTLADAATGIGTISKFDRFMSADGDGVHAKDRYVLHPVDPFFRNFLGIRNEYVDAAVASAGVDLDKVFYEIIRLPQAVIDAAEASGEDGLHADAAAQAEEIWVAAFGDDNDPEGVSLPDVNFVRVL